MTDPEITQLTREIAHDAFTTIYEDEPNPMWLTALLAGNHDDDEVVQFLARVITEAEQRGRAEGAAQERAEIVAWLREKAPQYSHEHLADAIERGEYKRSE